MFLNNTGWTIILQLYFCVRTSLVDCIWTRPFAPLSQNYRGNLLRRWVLVHQKLGGKPITFHGFISVWLWDGLRESTTEVLGIAPVYKLPKDVGIYLEFLRTMSSFLMDLQNDCCRQEPLPAFHITLSLPISSRKSFQVLRNYAKQSSYQIQPELLRQIDKPYYLWTCVRESSYQTWSDLVF